MPWWDCLVPEVARRIDRALVIPGAELEIRLGTIDSRGSRSTLRPGVSAKEFEAIVASTLPKGTKWECMEEFIYRVDGGTDVRARRKAGGGICLFMQKFEISSFDSSLKGLPRDLRISLKVESNLAVPSIIASHCLILIIGTSPGTPQQVHTGCEV